MLRPIVIGLAALLTLLATLAACVSHHPKSWISVVWAAVFLLCALLERIRYKPELATPPDGSWLPSAEITSDSRGIVRVWVHTHTGERAYVREAAP